MSQTQYPPYGSGGSYTAVSLTADDTLEEYEQVAFCDATSGAVEVTLPSVAGIPFTVKKTDSSGNAVTLAANADGAAVSMTTQYEWKTVIYDGSVWYIVSEGS